MKAIQFRTIILLICAGIFQSSVIFAAADRDALFHQGNEEFSRSEFQAASETFTQLTESEGFSSAVLYNMANSYSQSGKTGKAILTYERALRLSPSDPDIRGNLELLRKEQGLFPKEPSNTEEFFSLLTIRQWSLLALCSLAVIALFQLIGLRYRFTRKTTVTVLTLSFLAFSMGSMGTVFEYRLFNPSVVIATDARILVSPFSSATSIGALQEGRLVYPEKHHHNFSYVADETDRKGWIPAASIEAVVAKE